VLNLNQGFVTIQKFNNGWVVLIGNPATGSPPVGANEVSQQVAIMNAILDSVVEINALGGEAAAKGADDGIEPWKASDEGREKSMEEKKEAAKRKVRESFAKAMTPQLHPSIQPTTSTRDGAYIFLTLQKAIQFAAAFLAGDHAEAKSVLSHEVYMVQK
jgi:hypothetical protein